MVLKIQPTSLVECVKCQFVRINVRYKYSYFIDYQWFGMIDRESNYSNQEEYLYFSCYRLELIIILNARCFEILEEHRLITIWLLN